MRFVHGVSLLRLFIGQQCGTNPDWDTGRAGRAYLRQPACCGRRGIAKCWDHTTNISSPVQRHCWTPALHSPAILSSLRIPSTQSAHVVEAIPGGLKEITPPSSTSRSIVVGSPNYRSLANDSDPNDSAHSTDGPPPLENPIGRLSGNVQNRPCMTDRLILKGHSPTAQLSKPSRLLTNTLGFISLLRVEISANRPLLPRSRDFAARG